MASLWVLACLMLAASTTADSDTESNQQKFLVVAPRRLLAGKHEKIWVSYTGDKHVKKFPVTINLFKPDSNETLASVTYKYSRATLEVVAGSGDQEIRRSAQVDLEHSEALTFIETDRPYYKPGELISTIWVENPARIRMAQWQNVQTYNGLAQLKPRDGCQNFTVSKEELQQQRERHAISILVQASVEEAGTGEVQVASQKSEIHHDETKIKFVKSPAYFKPYLPYHGKLRVTLRNGKPLEGKEVKLVLKLKKTSHSPWVPSWNLPHQDTKNFTSDSNGFISFIVVDHSYQPLKCGSNHGLSIMYTYDKNTTKSIKFTYLIQSKGDIMKQIVHEEHVRDAKIRPELRASKNNITLGKLPAQEKMLPVGRWNLKLEISTNMAPLSQLLVYYIRPDAVDKAVTFLSGDHALTQSIVFEQLKRFDIGPAPYDGSDYQPCFHGCWNGYHIKSRDKSQTMLEGGPEEKSFDLETPHSITDWIVNTVCVSVADGLGIAPPTSIKVFKPYFMDFTLPYSIKRGEILPLKVRITFGDFTGGSLLSENTFSACLGEHSSLVHEFKLEPTGLGEHNITVTANVDSNFPTMCGPELLMDARDGLMKKIIVKPEGFPEDVTNSAFICLSDVGEQAALSWDFSLPENLVEGSDRAFISVIGDVMGPSLENLDGLVQLPMGCGEQNMILFVPNILVLNYLNSSGQYNPQLSSKAVSHMKKGYQRELTYRHSDGSYSAFGKSDPEGSLWLTAFVVKSFAQARKYIFVDVNDLKLSTSWIINKQLENGCFPFVGKVFHKDMKGGLGDDSSTTALSAYVLISLMETELEEINDKIIANAVYCMLGKDEQDVYTLALSTYALSLVHRKRQNLVGREQIDKNLQLLMSYSITNNSELRFEKPESKSLALNLEITAYAILTLTSLGGEDNLLHALNAVRWISKHRNANGGFVSTQDTIVALEALAKYAVSVPNKNISMEILSTTSSEDWSQEFSLTTENQLVLQQSNLPRVPTSINFLMKGRGCALVQSNLRYNVKNAYPSEAFNLTAQVSPVTGRSCSRLLLELEVAYNLVDGESNMAVIEIDMLSGYVPVKTSLDVLLLNTAVKLKRWDESNGKVNLYFDSLTSESISLSFFLEQAVEVENPKPSQVRVFDYYTPELAISTSYGLEDLKCFLEFLPEPIAIDEPSTSPPVAEVRSASNSQEIEAADEPDGDKAPKDPFENFTNVDHDLEFPEGNEGVEPVLVPAPLQAGNHILVLIFSKTDTPLTTVTKPAVHLEQGIHVVGLRSTSGNKATSNLLYQAKRLC
ncbi:hypothetical protein B566_EDAN016556 [Ephemera danica]|nr:hypothetical protein B566_EDAN016556 [Ephemera danica]